MAAQAGINTVSLEELRRRRSAKWTWYPDDVLPAWVAEMDFPVAPAIREALATAVEIDDLGYASADAAGLGQAFAGFAQRRFGWEVDPAQVTPLNDVVSGPLRLRPGADRAGRRGDHQPARLPPVLPGDRADGPGDRRGAARRRPRARHRRDRGRVCRWRPGADPLQSAQPDRRRPDVASSSAQIAEIAAGHDAWVLADEIHSPMVFAGGRARAVHDGVRRRRRTRDRAHLGVEGVQHRRAEVRGRDHRLRGRRGGEVAKLPEIAKHCGHFGVLASVAAFESARRVARRAGRRPRFQSQAAGRAARRAPAPGRLRPAAGRLSGVAGLPRARPRRRSRRGPARARPGSRSARGRSSAPAARASRGSTTPPRRSCCAEIVERIAEGAEA